MTLIHSLLLQVINALMQLCFHSFLKKNPVQLLNGSAQENVFHVLFRSPNVLKAQFLGDFDLFLEDTYLLSREHILLCGLKFHLDKQDS